MQLWLVVFKRQYIVGFLHDYFLRYFLLTACRVYRNYLVFYIYKVEQLRYSRYFVCLFRYGYLSQCDLVVRNEGADDMEGFVFRIGASAYRLSVDCDDGTFSVLDIKPVCKTLRQFLRV